MEGVSIVNTERFDYLLTKIEVLFSRVEEMSAELKEAKKPYLSTQEVMELTGFGKTWVNDNKQNIGFSSVGGALRFKRKDVEEYIEANYFKVKSKKQRYS